MYNLGIIGAGPAGYVAAEKAGKNGLKVVLFDKQYLGGVCLNEGCIPTKTLLYSAKLYDYLREGEKYGIISKEHAFNYIKMMERKDKIVKKLVAGITAKMKNNNVEVVMAEAKIKKANTEKIIIQAEGSDYECQNLLIATGSEAAIPPVQGLKDVDFFTNREILKSNTVPATLVIIGGGVIGIEFAGLFAALGVKVTVIEMLEEIIPGADKQLTAMLRQELTKKGVEFHLKAKVVKVTSKEVIFEKDKQTHKTGYEQLLVSVGRKSITQGFGLEKTGVELSGNGIKIDENCRTNIPNIYAAGDVTGFSLLAHTASREAEVAVNHILGKKDNMRYNAIPAVVYTNPELASVGITEEEAKEKGIKYKVRTLPMAYAGRFVAENEGKTGICKILVGESQEEILGVHLLGNPSSEIIYGAALAIETEMRVKDLEEIIFPHPTTSEIIKETINTF